MVSPSDETHSSTTNQKSSLVIKYLQDSPAKRKDLLLIPVIFSFDAQYQDSPEFFYRTCLACLYALSPTPVKVKTAREKYMNASQINDIDALVLNVLEDVATNIREQEAKPLEIVAVIDAVDETMSSQQQAFLQNLNRLIGSNRRDRPVRFRSILFSRDSQIIGHFCGYGHGWRKKEIPPLALREDILKMVSSRLVEDYNFQTWSVDDRKDLATQIATRANGMYVVEMSFSIHYRLTFPGSDWPHCTLST